MRVVRFEQSGVVGHIVLCDPPGNQIGRRWADDLHQAVHEASGSGVRALGGGDKSESEADQRIAFAGR